MTTEPHAALPPVVGSRPLTTRELLTIRAALRAWTLLDPFGGRDRALIEAGHVEIDGETTIDDTEVDRLLVELGVAGDVTLTPLHPADVRRI